MSAVVKSPHPVEMRSTPVRQQRFLDDAGQKPPDSDNRGDTEDNKVGKNTP